MSGATGVDKPGETPPRPTRTCPRCGTEFPLGELCPQCYGWEKPA